MPDSQNKQERRSYDAEITKLNDKIEQLTDTVDTLTKNIEGLVEAWNTAKGVTSFVKWLGSMATILATVYALSKGVKLHE